MRDPEPRHPEGQQILRALVRDADVLVENFRPGVLEKWGLGPERLHALVLSCDDVPTNPLPVTERQAGIDVGIARFATLSDGTGVDNPRWGRHASDRLTAAQQRLARAKRRSKSRDRKRETVAARHRKFANQRKDFHHKQARTLVGRYDLLVVEDLVIANMVRRAKPVPDVENLGQFLPNGARAKSGLNRSISDAGWASSSRFCAPKRKTLGAH